MMHAKKYRNVSTLMTQSWCKWSAFLPQLQWMHMCEHCTRPCVLWCKQFNRRLLDINDTDLVQAADEKCPDVLVFPPLKRLKFESELNQNKASEQTDNRHSQWTHTHIYVWKKQEDAQSSHLQKQRWAQWLQPIFTQIKHSQLKLHPNLQLLHLLAQWQTAILSQRSFSTIR